MGKQTFLHKLEYAPNIQALLQTNTDEKFNLDHTAPRLAYKTQEAHSFILNPFHLNTADSQDVKVFFPRVIIFPSLTCMLKPSAEKYV